MIFMVEKKEKETIKKTDKIEKVTKKSMSYADVLEARAQRGKKTHQKEFILNHIKGGK